MRYMMNREMEIGLNALQYMTTGLDDWYTRKYLANVLDEPAGLLHHALQKLKHAGFLEAQRGDGYRIKSIKGRSLMDFFEAFEKRRGKNPARNSGQASELFILQLNHYLESKPLVSLF